VKRSTLFVVLIPALALCLSLLGCGNRLSVQVIGDGSVTQDPDAAAYEQGAIVALTAVPSQGGQFLHWGEDLSGSANPATIVMDQDRTIEAYFLPCSLAGGTVILTAYPSQALAVGVDALFTLNLNLPQGNQYRVWILPDSYTGASGQNISWYCSASAILQWNEAGIIRGGGLGLYDAGSNWVDYAPGTVTRWKLEINTWDGFDNHAYKIETFPYTVTWQ
jgi:hypothetical protein